MKKEKKENRFLEFFKKLFGATEIESDEIEGATAQEKKEFAQSRHNLERLQLSYGGLQYEGGSNTFEQVVKTAGKAPYELTKDEEQSARAAEKMLKGRETTDRGGRE